MEGSKGFPVRFSAGVSVEVSGRNWLPSDWARIGAFKNSSDKALAAFLADPTFRICLHRETTRASRTKFRSIFVFKVLQV